MSIRGLRPWTDFLKLHLDVEARSLPEAVFAIDVGAIAEQDPNVPAVNRDLDAFFRATYLTFGLRKLLEEVLTALCGESGYNRVLKLRTPFGGGKSHTLPALKRYRDQTLNELPEFEGLNSSENFARIMSSKISHPQVPSDPAQDGLSLRSPSVAIDAPPNVGASYIQA